MKTISLSIEGMSLEDLVAIARRAAKVRLTRKKDMKVNAVRPARLEMDGQIVDVEAPEGFDDNPGGESVLVNLIFAP